MCRYNLMYVTCRYNLMYVTCRYNLDASWSETGDRYLLKLFRDYLFHQVNADGMPWVDMAHVIQCLNKVYTSCVSQCLVAVFVISHLPVLCVLMTRVYSCTDAIQPSSSVPDGPLFTSFWRHFPPASAFSQQSPTLPRYQLSTYGHRAFSVAGPTVWNSLPEDFRDLECCADSYCGWRHFCFCSTSVSSALEVFTWMRYTNLHLIFDICVGCVPHDMVTDVGCMNVCGAQTPCRRHRHHNHLHHHHHYRENSFKCHYYVKCESPEIWLLSDGLETTSRPGPLLFVFWC